jgi:1-acyl-sn-glycerol-3-phosphate acyltransferase
VIGLTFAPMERQHEPAIRRRRESGLEMLRAARDASLRSSERRAVARGSRSMPAEQGDGMWRGESLARRWSRRAITIPGLYLATALFAVLLPLLLAHALVSDLVRRRSFMLCRFHLTLFAIFVWHCVGVVSVAVWWGYGRLVRMDERGWRTWHGGLESWWSHKLIGIARLLYGVKVEVEGAELVRPGPALLLLRHTSIVDTMLPMGYLGGPRAGVLMRTVKKRELLWDPCVDLISSRVPRTFVRRQSGAIDRELEALAALTDGMDDDDVVAMFPEGTRFTASKQAEVLAKLRDRDPAAALRAGALRHLLPVRPAGTMALLDRRGDLDVVFCAHTGLEGASKLEDFMSGALLGRVWKIKLWRVLRSEVPTDPEARLAWLEDQWRRVDAWIDANREYGAPHARRHGRRRAA